MSAHVALLRTEIGEIIDQVKVIAALSGVILALALFALNLLAIGSLLFIGEALFGSLGWGVVHGVFLLVGIITAVTLVLFMAPAGVVGGGFLAAALVGVAVAAVLALDLPRRGAELAAAALRLDPGPGPLIAGLAVGAIVLGLIGLVVGLRAGAAAPSLIGGAILGAVIGAFLGGMSFSVHGGIALGLAVGLAAWPVFQLGLASRAGVSPTTRFERLKPHQTIETAQETRAWLEAEWTKRREGLTKR